MYPQRKIPDDAKRLTTVAIGPQSLKFLALRFGQFSKPLRFPHQSQSASNSYRCSERAAAVETVFFKVALQFKHCVGPHRG
jgi:hypothetical protein